MDKKKREQLEYSAYQLRVDSLRATTQAGSGHPTSCLSAADIMAVLFFDVMYYNPHNPKQANNDQFILSKGHAAPVLYALYKQLGIIDDEQLLTLRQFDSVLEGHPTPRFYYNSVATGSLGCGLSIGLGMALTSQLDQQKNHVYVLLGDSECAEGSVWEAAEVAAYYKVNRLIAIVDCNRLGQSTQTMDGHDTKKIADKFKAFGWTAFEVDGHDVTKLSAVFKKAHQVTETPVVIVAKTFKGYGLTEVQNQQGYHGKAFSEKELPLLLEQLQEAFAQVADYTGQLPEVQLPELTESDITCADIALPIPDFETKEAPRKAFGKAITRAGSVCPSVVCFDAEVKNSTFTYLFEQMHPERFFQSFIAEQNMIGMATGAAARKKIPFVATFAAFLTRAFDQIRMAAISKQPLRIAGTHCGVSIGSDGPSQMGLEDIAMMRTLPDSIVLYPSDAVSTFKLVELMANYYEGISYIRLTRAELPVLYKKTDTFKIGGCKIVRQPDNVQALIIAAGITVHQAVIAADILEQENIKVAVVDLYCIKPLDIKTILDVAQKSCNKIITVEDHYLEGGLGQTVAAALSNHGITVTTLAVTALPRSGTSEELLSWAGIDADAIIKAVKKQL